MPFRSIMLAVIAAFIWGATFPFSALALEETPPLFFTFLRFLAAGAFIIVVPRPKMAWHYIAFLGVLLGAGQYGLMFFAMANGFPAGLASLLIHTQAFFTVIMAMIFFRETPGVRHAIAGAVALAGLLVLVYSRIFGMQDLWRGIMLENYDNSVKNAAEEGVEVLGHMLILIAAIEYAIRRYSDRDTRSG